MAKIYQILAILLLAWSALLAQADLFDIGTDQNPPGISWRSLESRHFQIIFPQEIAADAQRIASLLERVYPADCKTLGIQPGPLPLILHSRTTESNGFVTLAPRRSEWFSTPPQVGLTGPVGWYPLLAIHEYRHVVQFQALKQGFNRLLYWSLGEYGWLAGAGISVPAWFFEGDAVVMETALTRGGRGRQPEFLMPIRTMLLSGERYSYYKMNLGSYKNWIANPYEYGFYLNTWLRRQHGAELWPAVLKSTAKLSFIPYRFSWSLKRRTGMGLMKSHAAMLAELEAHYRTSRPQPGTAPAGSEAVRRNPGGSEMVGGRSEAVRRNQGGNEMAGGVNEAVRRNPGGNEMVEGGNEAVRRNPGGNEMTGGGNEMTGGETAVQRWNRDNDGFWTIYQAPRPAADGSLIVLKIGLADQTAFIRLHPDGREETLLHPNPVDGSPHSIAGETLVWSEEVYDPRWGRQDFRTIKSLDLVSGTRRTLVARGRHFAPALSPDGAHIAAILFETDNGCHLVLLSAQNGSEMRRFDNPANDFLMTPTWSPDGREIVCSRLCGSGRALTLISLDDGRMTDLIPPGDWEITTLFHGGRYILFSSNDGEVMQIFAVERQSGRLFRVTDRPFGAFYPALSGDGRRLFFGDYDLNGYHVAESSLDSSRWIPLDSLPVMENPWFEPVTAQEAGPALLDDLAPHSWPVRPFTAWNDRPRIHSWQVYADDPSRTLGGSLFAQNLLSTLQASAGFDFDRDENAGAISADLTWARLYPLLSAGVTSGHRASTYLDENDKTLRYTWKEKSARATILLPLNLSRNGYTTALSLQGAAQLTWISGISDDNAFERWENQSGWFRTMGYGLEFYRYRKSGADIFPVLGQTLRLGYNHTPWGSRYQGERFILRANLYLPGLVRRHGLALRGDYERQRPESYRFSGDIRFPRGYSYRYQDRIGRLAVDYTLPLAYPDQHLWALLYVQRVKSLFFHDYGWSSLAGRRTFYRSSGVELSADVNFFSLPVILDVGVRLVWRWREKNWRTEATLNLPL